MNIKDIAPSPKIDWLRKNAPHSRKELVKTWFYLYGRKLGIQYWPHQGQRECARRRNQMPQRELQL
jgi:hypothetical protein